MTDRPRDQSAETPASNPASELIGSMVSGLGSSWAASTEAMLAWTDTWRSLMASRGGPLSDAMLQTMSDPSAWPTALVPLLDEVRAALTLPKFADLPGLDAVALPSPMPLLNLIKVSQDYMAVGVPVWLEACRRFEDEVTALRGSDGGGASAGDLLDAWNGVLDRTLMEFNRSGDFAAAQQRLLHAAVQHRHEVRTTFEKAAKAVDLPTRTEMNDIYQRMHDLTREVHALRRELRTLRKAAAGRIGEGRDASAQSHEPPVAVPPSSDEPHGSGSSLSIEAPGASDTRHLVETTPPVSDVETPRTSDAPHAGETSPMVEAPAASKSVHTAEVAREPDVPRASEPQADEPHA